MTGTDDVVRERFEARTADRPWRRWVVIATVVASVALAVFAVVWGLDQRAEAVEVRERIEREQDALEVASDFVEALMSYDHEDLDAQQAAVEVLATDRFRTDYAEAFTSEVRDEIIAEEASSSVVVDAVYLTADDGDELRAIVQARSEVTSGRGASADLESYLLVRLVRLGDRWRVDDLSSLGSRDLSPPLAAPSADGERREGESGG